MAVGGAERLEIRLAERGAHRLEGGDLLRTEPADAGGVRRGGEEDGGRLLGVEFVRVHDQPLFAGVGQVIGRRQRQPLGDDVIAGEPDPGVVRGEPADHLGESVLLEELVSEDPVADVVRAVEASRLVVQPVHADVMQQGAGPRQVDVDLSWLAPSREWSCSAMPHTIRQCVCTRSSAFAVGACFSCRPRISSSVGIRMHRSVARGPKRGPAASAVAVGSTACETTFTHRAATPIEIHRHEHVPSLCTRRSAASSMRSGSAVTSAMNSGEMPA